MGKKLNSENAGSGKTHGAFTTAKNYVMNNTLVEKAKSKATRSSRSPIGKRK